ncbi:MAG: hypothetical protein GXP55_16100 [Deltaproteobacteria bacterium]|nr:hypothetical protein [Deltaproteobacteria bacterium]
MAHDDPAGSEEQATPYRPNALLRWVYRRFFAHIRVDESWSTKVRESARRGVVVYVMRSISILDFLCLDFLVKRFGLPLVRFVNDLGLWILEPFGKGDRRLRLRRQIPEEEALRQVIVGGQSAQLFLRRPPRLGRAGRKGQELEADLIRTLVVTQRELDTPILLLPQTFVFSMRPPQPKPSVVDFLFGPVEWPGRVRVLFQFLLNYKNAKLRSGEPFDLAEFIGQHTDLTDEEIADKVRYALLRRMERERTVVLGPRKKTVGRMQEELLRSPRVQKPIESEMRTTGKSRAAVERKVRRILNRLAARQTPTMIAFLHRVLNWVWSRIYDGIVIDEEGMERLREAMRDGAVVLLPSHKSHVDYLVLSYVLYEHALSPPLIAAGENLSFWPLGPVLRRGGAFFIRRSFKGKKLYAALVDAYVRKLLVEGSPIEFFLEGGRSRTGKLLPPKYGLLSMVVDNALKLNARRVAFVPVSIGYERVVEERSYVHELGGGEKEREDVGGLLRTPKILRARYGRLYVQVGEILRFEQIRAEALEPGDDPRTPLTPRRRRALVQRLAHRVSHEIDRVTVVTPAALMASALLVHRKRGISRGELTQTAQELVEALAARGARVATPILDAEGRLRDDTRDQALALFLDARLVSTPGEGEEPIYAIADERRIALEYYKNNILHFFVASAVIATPVMRSASNCVALEELREAARRLSRLFKYEFMYRADAPFDEIFEESLARMVKDGELRRGDDGIGLGKRGGRVALYASMLHTYVESYRLALLALAPGEEPTKREWVKRALTLGQRLYLAGEIELRESISKPRLLTALTALRDHGLVRFGPEDRVATVPDEASRREELGDWLESLLP